MSISNNQELIYQSIIHGSPFEAIELNLFSCTEFVDFLASKGNQLPKEKLYLSFCALMRNYPNVYHYSAGQHLLTFFEKDSFLNRIFVILGGSPELPLGKDDLNNTLWSLLFDEYSDFISDNWSEDIEKAMLLCDKVTPKLSKKIFVFNEKEFIKTLYDFRCENVLNKYPNLVSNLQFSIDTDWFLRYPLVKNNYSKFINRIEYLQKQAPLYYECMKNQFLNLFSELSLKEFENIDNNLLKKTCFCFSDQFSNIEVKEEYQKLCIYPINIRAYILGLSIYPKIPSKKVVDQSLIRLSEIGIDAFVDEFIKNQTRIKYTEDQIANTEDTLFETPENYVDFDCIDIEENGKIYQFTRPEFSKLLSDKKNFWTKQPISFSDLYTIQIRINMAKVMNLPNPETLKVLIEKACKGILYQESITVPNNSYSSPTSSFPSSFSSSLFSSLPNPSSNTNANNVYSTSFIPASSLYSGVNISSELVQQISSLINNPNNDQNWSGNFIQYLQTFLNDPNNQINIVQLPSISTNNQSNRTQNNLQNQTNENETESDEEDNEDQQDNDLEDDEESSDNDGIKTPEEENEQNIQDDQ
jgi:hypothetical protein